MGVSDLSKPDAVESLVQVLKKDWNILARKNAAESLGETGDARAVEPLFEALRDDSQNLVRQAAADALDKLGWKPRDDTEKAYLLIAREKWDELAGLGVEPLIQAFKHAIATTEAMRALVGIREPAVEPLIQALKSEHFGVRRAAAQALGEIGDARAVEPLAQALKDKLYDVRLPAARALDKLGFQPRDDTEKAHLLIAREKWGELAEVGEPAVEPLIQVVRRLGKPEAAKALVRIGAPAVEPLIQALEAQASFARWQAATALGDIGDARGVEPLTRALQDRNSDVREAAKKALEKIKAQKSRK